MKQIIEKYLNNIPAIKLLFNRIDNIENQITVEVERLQQENKDLKKEIYRLNNRIDNSNREMNYMYQKGLHPDCYEIALKDYYYYRTGENLDLENPVTFNEKIQWLKLYDNTPLKTRLADKYLVREWVAEKIGEKYLIPLIGVWDCFDDIDFELLPEKFVLKTNHGSAYNLIVKNKNEMNRSQTKSKFDFWMKHNYAFVGLELHYMNISRKIIAEKYMEDLVGEFYDYKFFCFNGQPRYVWVNIENGTSNHKRNIYDLDWNLQEYTAGRSPIIPSVEKPEKFEELVELTKKLCVEFSFVRVDFYLVNNTIYFGEMTFTPQCGICKWDDKKYDLHYGSLIELPEKKGIPKREY